VTEPTPNDVPEVAVAIPCYNEAAAIAEVIASWRRALPQAEIIVFDNNSTDGTGSIAQGQGARVIPVPQQGKGHAVQAIFREFIDRPIVVLVDGDGTYPAAEIDRLLAPIREDRADMVVGARQPVDQPGAMTPVRGFGNLIIRSAFWLLIGGKLGDLLSGYRVFNRRFREAVTLRSAGFEIETELASEAVVHRMRVVELSVPYYPRIAGTVSKLRAFRDGRRILRTILTQSLRHRPWRLILALAFPAAVVALFVYLF
jgi:glycosyltransferase involved in cell wall biosynthesis